MKKLNEKVIELLDECIPNGRFGKFEDGEEIFIIDDINSKERFMYEVTKLACGQELLEEHYSHKIVKSKYSDEKRLDDGSPWLHSRAYNYIPDEIVDKFILAGIIESGELPTFEEIVGCDYGYSDTYTTCHSCNSVVRLYRSSGPREYFVFTDGSLLCGSCVKEEPEEYLKELVNEPGKANTFLSEDVITSQGFMPYKERESDLEGTVYESGMHLDHSNTSPIELFDRLKYEYEEIVFHIKSSSPFQVYYKAYVKNKIEKVA
jgi:hypothetical protein